MPVISQVDGFWVAAGAPSPTACQVDADCMGNTAPAEDLCCNAPSPMRAYARVYWEWTNMVFRKNHCGGHECPPPPPPPPPRECEIKVQCAAGRCADTCSP